MHILDLLSVKKTKFETTIEAFYIVEKDSIFIPMKTVFLKQRFMISKAPGTYLLKLQTGEIRRYALKKLASNKTACLSHEKRPPIC
jgi:hypothetical protein